MKLLKWLFRLVIVPLIVFFAGLLLAFQLIPQAKLRAYAARKLESRIHRQVELGTIHLDLRGVIMDDLRLSEIPSFSSGTLLTAKGVHLGWDLHSLWNGLDMRQKRLTRSKGSFHLDEFHHPHYSAHDFSLTWSLSEIDPTWSHLSGWAEMHQGPGLLENIDQWIETNPSVKLALMPITMLMNLERTGFVRLGLPDLHHWPIQGIEGDYAFDAGMMHIRHFTLKSAALEMTVSGIVELATGKLSLDVRLKTPARTVLGAMDIKTHVTGTVSHPKADLESLKKKAFQATITNLLENPDTSGKDVHEILKKLFR